MKAISLHQPWASLWLTWRKVHETRSWSTKHRGDLAVHASKRLELVDGPLLDIVIKEFGPGWERQLPLGCVIGVVNIIDCIPTDVVLGVYGDNLYCGDWSPGRFAWERYPRVRVLEDPIPYRGRQGLFNIRDELIP